MSTYEIGETEVLETPENMDVEIVMSETALEQAKVAYDHAVEVLNNVEEEHRLLSNVITAEYLKGKRQRDKEGREETPEEREERLGMHRAEKKGILARRKVAKKELKEATENLAKVRSGEVENEVQDFDDEVPEDPDA